MTSEVRPVMPVHLAGRKAIARAFSVSTRTVEEWEKDGMPHAKHGTRTDGEFNAIQAWRERKNKAQ